MDKFSKETRSRIMSAIRSKNTSPERLVFRALKQRGIYFQRHYKRALGSPDIAIPLRRKAIFIDGDKVGDRYRGSREGVPRIKGIRRFMITFT